MRATHKSRRSQRRRSCIAPKPALKPASCPSLDAAFIPTPCTSPDAAPCTPIHAASDPPRDLHLLIAWPDPFAVFTGNLSDRLHRRVIPGLVTTSPPDHGFWRGIDILTPIPSRGLIDSVFAHAALLALLYAISIWPQSGARLADPFSHRALHAYSISPYLPELHGARAHRAARGKPDPVAAKQEILSLPNNPDNLRQTVVTPPKIKLKQDVDLPNLVAYAPPAPVQPLAASERDPASLRLPKLMPMPEVIAPAADTASLRSSRRLSALQPQVIEPSPEVAVANPRLALPTFQPKVVEPAPDLSRVSRGSPANLAHLAPQIAQPDPAQPIPQPAAQPIPPPIPEAPQVADALRTSAQVIVLNLHPAEIRAPVEVPSGNRRGTFAASPTGRSNAAGAPGADAAIGSGAGESKAPINAPAGISVTAVPAPPAPIGSNNASNNASNNTQAAPADPDLRAKFMAAMRPPPLASIPPRQPVARESTKSTPLENRIFAGRRSYTLSVNMPNLNAATGSWIIHFAEHSAQRDAGPISTPIAAPEVLSKSDPAYPGDLLGVQGVVVLTAIIHADGSVSNVAIVQSLDPRLDQNAAEAFSHWLFRPALKDGKTIDLEAVVTVPFRAKAAKF